MKKLLFAMTILAAVAVAPVFGQNATLRATVPHDFVVNGHSLPAGEYEVAESFGAEAVYIRNIERKDTVMVLAFGATASQGDANLTFRVADGKYYLTSYTRNGTTKDVTLKNAPEGGVLATVKAIFVKR